MIRNAMKREKEREEKKRKRERNEPTHPTQRKSISCCTPDRAATKPPELSLKSHVETSDEPLGVMLIGSLLETTTRRLVTDDEAKDERVGE